MALDVVVRAPPIVVAELIRMSLYDVAAVRYSFSFHTLSDYARIARPASPQYCQKRTGHLSVKVVCFAFMAYRTLSYGRCNTTWQQKSRRDRQEEAGEGDPGGTDLGLGFFFCGGSLLKSLEPDGHNEHVLADRASKIEDVLGIQTGELRSRRMRCQVAV